jgi:hypothetical protein
VVQLPEMAMAGALRAGRHQDHAVRARGNAAGQQVPPAKRPAAAPGNDFAAAADAEFLGYGGTSLSSSCSWAAARC